MHELRRKDLLGSLKGRYQLMDSSTAKAGITGRDVRGVEKVLSGLLKLMYPHGEVTDEQLGELLEVALKGGSESAISFILWRRASMDRSC
jgi:ATP-dependent Lon protease